MIDLGEPARKEYTDEEKKVLKQNFFVTLHSFLLVYLTLHNFLIPLMANFFKGHVFWDHMHFWFLVHIPVNIYLRRGKLSRFVFFFLLFGSLTRLSLESYLTLKLASWGMLSIYLSEVSSLLFFVFYYPEVGDQNNKIVPGALSGILLAGLFSLAEISIRPDYFQKADTKSDFTKLYGCKGSTNKLHFPLGTRPTSNSININECGFHEDEIYVKGRLEVKNKTGLPLNMRIYQLKWSGGRLSWKFIRLLQVSPTGILNVEEFAKFERPLLLKIPERKNLGHLLIVPEKSSEHFPPGELELTYNSLNWRGHE